MERFICDIYNKQLKIEHGDLSFKYNIECANGHKKINISMKDLLTTFNLNENLFKCPNIKKSSKLLNYLQERSMFILS